MGLERGIMALIRRKKKIIAPALGAASADRLKNKLYVVLRALCW